MQTETRFIFPDWPAPAHIKSATSYRTKGVSRPPYEGFNLATHVGDDPRAVSANRYELTQLLSLPSEPVWLNQTHSTTVIDAAQKHPAVNADGSFTTHAGIVAVVLTADCLPLLICDHQGTVVAAVHAGWRGLCDGIIEKAIQGLPVKADELMVWLGPAIGPQAFEVGLDVYTAFIADNPLSKTAFLKTAENKWLANIYELARIRLNLMGVTQIYGGTECTFTNREHYYSYRRENSTGRIASLIWMEAPA